MKRKKYTKSVFLFLIVLLTIIGLSLMSSDGTRRLTEMYRTYFPNWLVYPKLKIFGQVITVRQGAHIYEYFALGCAAMYLVKAKNIVLRSIRAMVVCVLISNLDQMIKPILAGREYDWMDLIYDAIGYGTAIIICSAIFFVLWLYKKEFIRRIKDEQE